MAAAEDGDFEQRITPDHALKEEDTDYGIGVPSHSLGMSSEARKARTVSRKFLI
ncbi:hypothetical protein Mapa_007351 [Marchantia paleacea]|nr:hypothetical protein Mapa_007351 [Marchantia paleacea]